MAETLGEKILDCFLWVWHEGTSRRMLCCIVCHREAFASACLFIGSIIFALSAMGYLALFLYNSVFLTSQNLVLLICALVFFLLSSICFLGTAIQTGELFNDSYYSMLRYPHSEGFSNDSDYTAIIIGHYNSSHDNLALSNSVALALEYLQLLKEPYKIYQIISKKSFEEAYTNPHVTKLYIFAMATMAV